MRRHHGWHWDIDRLLNPLLPAPPWRRLPYGLAHFLGHRRAKPAATGNLMPIFWAFVGILGSLLLIEAVTARVPLFREHGVPTVIGSFGAAAVLEFCTIDSPLAQPRNAVVGQLLAAVTAVGIAKLFQLGGRFDELSWLAGALACACATALMALTVTVHPPAGATALLAVVDPRLARLGWLLLPVVMLGCGLMLAVALLVNNIERRFPLYWWTPHDLSRRAGSGSGVVDVAGAGPDGPDGPRSDAKGRDGDDDEDDDERTIGVGASPSAPHGAAFSPEIVVRPGCVVVPKHVTLTPEEERMLQFMSQRLMLPSACAPDGW